MANDSRCGEPIDNGTTEKLREGLDLTAQRLLEHKQKADGTLIFGETDGSVYPVKAREIDL